MVPKDIDGSTCLASGLVETQVMSELLLADGAGRVDLVAEDEERHLGELLDGEQRVELRLGLGEPLNVDAVDEEDDAVDLREVIPPEAACCSRQVGLSS